MRELTGMQPIDMFEFSGHRLATVLTEVAIWAVEQESRGATLTMSQQWNEEDGYLIHVFRTL